MVKKYKVYTSSRYQYFADETEAIAEAIKLIKAGFDTEVSSYELEVKETK